MTAPNMTTQGFGWSLDQSVTANAISITLTNPPAAVVNQALVGVVPANANTGAVTLTITNAPAPWSSANAIYFQGSPLVAGMFNAGDLLTVAWNDPAARWDAHINPLMLNKYVFSGADGRGDNAITETAASFTLASSQSGQQIIATSAGAAVTLPPATLGLNYDLWMTGGTITAPSGVIVNEWQSAASFAIPSGNVQHVRLLCDGTNWHLDNSDMVVTTAITFNVGGSSPNFGTMMAAIEWIRQLTVLDGGSVTLYECRSSVTEQYAITGLYAPWLTITSSPSLSSGVDLPFATTGYVVLQSGAYNETYNGTTYQFSLTDCVLNIDGTWIYNTTTLFRSLVGQVRGGISVLNGSSFTHTAHTNSCVDVFGGRMFFDGALVAANTSAVANGVSAYAGSDVVVGANASIQAGSPVWTQGGRITTIGANLYLTSGPCLASNSGIIQFESGSLEVLTGCSSNGGLMMAEGAATILVGASFSIPTWTGSTAFGFVAQYGGIIQYTGSFPAPVAGMVLAQVQYGGTINFQMKAYSGPAAAAYAGKVISGGVIQFAVDPTSIWTDGYNQAPNSITTQGLIIAPSASNTPITSAYAATATPIMDGTAAVGVSLDYARQDHVHPTDTSRAPVTSIGNFAGVTGYNATSTMTTSQIGHIVIYYGTTAAQSLTLPTAYGGANTPWSFLVSNISTQPITLMTQGASDGFMLSNGTFPTSLVLQSGESLDLMAQSSGQWAIVGGTGAYNANGSPLICTRPVTVPRYTVATLPAGAAGMKAIVTDATSPTFLGALTGGGTVVTPVFYNGSAWVAG